MFETGKKLPGQGAGGGRANGLLGGRPSNAQREMMTRATARVIRKLDRAASKIASTYIKLAQGYEKKVTRPDGSVSTEFVVDPATNRDAIGKFVPAARQEIELSGTFKIVKMDSYDPDNEIDVTPSLPAGNKVLPSETKKT
ncbi:MAG: hypothetical protein U1E51_25050 [Candidatus Binatia bacterium]|nr:hypothetical protein [Candidatus Binatia bacterium]